VTTLRLAHRGDWRHAPENSLGAMRAALAIPACDGLEFDIRFSKDGVPILLHDPTLDRVLGDPAAAAEMTAEALSRRGVPTLAEILAEVLAVVASADRPVLDVELKEPANDEFVALLSAARGSDDGGLDRAVVSSFHLDVVADIAARRPDWPRWLNSHDLEQATIERAAQLGCVGIAAEWTLIDERSAGRVRGAGLDLAAFTVRGTKTFDRLARIGVVFACVEGAALDG
jgi:glycerophosphoryl diester phosphodiesterase